MSKERNSGIVLGLLAGAAIGSLLGVLFAPEKGSETRKRMLWNIMNVCQKKQDKE